jgi:hypothetical protein
VNRATRLAAVGAVVAVVLLLAGCNLNGPPKPPPPPRPAVSAGPGWAAVTAYLAAHPVRPPNGMMAGILVRYTSPSWAGQNLDGDAWTGTVVIPGGRTVQLTSYDGDSGMSSYVQPGDLFEFPAGNIPVDAPGDDVIDGGVAKLLLRAAVDVGGTS